MKHQLDKPIQSFKDIPQVEANDKQKKDAIKIAKSAQLITTIGQVFYIFLSDFQRYGLFVNLQIVKMQPKPVEYVSPHIFPEYRTRDD